MLSLCVLFIIYPIIFYAKFEYKPPGVIKMFVFNLHPSRKKICRIAILAAGISLLFLFCRRPHTKPPLQSPELSTNLQRVSYIQSLGWQIRTAPVETLHILLPKPLTEPYLSYNQLQKKQGFNLDNYDGKQIIRYTYSVTNFPRRPDGVQLNLYLYKNIPIAGDIIALGENGFRTGLAFPGKK